MKTWNILFIEGTGAGLARESANRLRALRHSLSVAAPHNGTEIFYQSARQIPETPRHELSQTRMGITKPLDQNLRTVNELGNSEYISEFIEWSRSIRRADHELLWIYSHGYGGPSPMFDAFRLHANDEGLLSSASLNAEDLLLRPLAGDGPLSINLAELEAALAEHHVDVLFLEACQIGQFETACAVQNGADYLVASSKFADASGVPHELWSDWLMSESFASVEPKALATRILGAQAFAATSEGHAALGDHRTHTGVVVATNRIAEIKLMFDQLLALTKPLRAGPSTAVDLWSVVQSIKCRAEAERLQSQQEDAAPPHADAESRAYASNKIIDLSNKLLEMRKETIASAFASNDAAFDREPVFSVWLPPLPTTLDTE